ncbi:MAG: hypothetical protein LBN03_02405 [Bifidobacteriaceae bacterium]|jgi:hypothetical protein|nr:hypothetical protein [Bifidobacteriaceae bacterium]
MKDKLIKKSPHIILCIGLAFFGFFNDSVTSLLEFYFFIIVLYLSARDVLLENYKDSDDK